MEPIRRQLRALQTDRNLSRFVIRDARSTDRQLGIGSYGSVQEVEVNGLVCAGKTIHEALLDAENIGGENIAQKYIQECQLMSDLRHPNVTQFLGLCFLPPAILPVLVMERLEGSLDDLLESTPNIPLAVKRSILEDVARGLLYLHKRDPPIIHRDLTAKNVLLTSSFAAKITDLGNSRIVNFQPGQLARTMSRLPGTLSYMPPEALSLASRYGPSLDIFSFGHLCLFTGVQVFPGDLLEPNYPDPDNPERLVGRSEVERRRVYFEQLENSLLRGEQHPIVRLTKQCLHNDPARRPTAEVVLRTLEEMKAEIDGPYGSYNIVKQDLLRQVEVARTLRQSESEIRRKDEAIRRLQQELQETQVERAFAEERFHNEVAELTTHLNQAQVERERAEENVGRVQGQLQQLEMERASFEQRLRDQTIQAEREINHLQREYEHQLQQFQVSVDGLRAESAAKSLQLRDRDAEISRLLSEYPNYQLQRLETPLSQLTRLPLRLTWRRGRNLPVRIEQYPRVVAIGQRVYIGGGYSETVMACDIDRDIITTLPSCNYHYCGITAHNSNLVLVGGSDPTSWRKNTDKLCVWDIQLKNWTRPYPPMTIPSYGSCVISYKSWIIVVGGRRDDNRHLSRVEILDTSTELWYPATPLPEPCSDLTSCIIGNTCYLLGGWVRDSNARNKRVYTVSLDELIINAMSPSTGASPTICRWSTLTDTPHTLSTALAYKGSLLAVGGWDPLTSDIFAYHPGSKAWVKVGDLPTQRCTCACTILPNGELLIAGGGPFGTNNASRVDIAIIED